MRKKYRNEIFHLISKVGFNQDEFELIENNQEGLITTTIEYKNSPFKFIIISHPTSFEYFKYQYTPYGPISQLTDITPVNGHVQFNSVFNEVNYWLNEIIKTYIEDEKK